MSEQGGEIPKVPEQQAATPTTRTRQFFRNLRSDAEMRFWGLAVPFNAVASAVAFATTKWEIGAAIASIGTTAAWKTKERNQEINQRNEDREEWRAALERVSKNKELEENHE